MFEFPDIWETVEFFLSIFKFFVKFCPRGMLSTSHYLVSNEMMRALITVRSFCSTTTRYN